MDLLVIAGSDRVMDVVQDQVEMAWPTARWRSTCETDRGHEVCAAIADRCWAASRDAGSKKDSEKERTVQRSQSRRRRVIDRDELFRRHRGKRGRKRSASRKGAKTVIDAAAHKRVIGVDETIGVGEPVKA